MLNFINKFKKTPADVFLGSIQDFGLEVNKIVEGDGIHWCKMKKSPLKDGYYVLFSDTEGTLHGMFGNWKENVEHLWHEMDDNEGVKPEVEQKLAEIRKKILGKQKRTIAHDLWSNAKPLDNKETHPFLQKKQIGKLEIEMRISEGKLFIPLRNINGSVTVLHAIDTTGNKTFINESWLKGKCMAFLGDSEIEASKVLYICDDFETAATVFLATGSPVFSALDSSNVKWVLLDVHKKYPGRRIILITDTGLKSEEKNNRKEILGVVKRISGTVTFPSFVIPGNGRKTFSDLLLEEGMGKVKEQLCIGTSATGARVSSVPIPAKKASPKKEKISKKQPCSVDISKAESQSKPESQSAVKNNVPDANDTHVHQVSPVQENQKTEKSIVSGISSDSLVDFHFQEWPTTEPEMFEGFAGDFVNSATENSEADPVAVLVTFLVRFGIEIGKGIYALHPDEQPGRINAVLVGSSGLARKGTSAGPVKELFKFEESETLKRANVSFGPLSSGEGVIDAVKDPVKKWKEKDGDTDGHWIITDPGVTDKRLFILESEFGSALECMRRAGNTLSNIICCIYDGCKLAPMTKKDKISSTGHHVGIVAHITQEELLKKLGKNEMYNGFANRFLWICVRRSGKCPFPEIMNPEKMRAHRKTLDSILHWAKLNQGRYFLSKDGRQFWEEHYSIISQEREGIISSILSRTAINAIRLALIYAVLDCSKEITRKHLKSALAVCRYVNDSVENLFGDTSNNVYIEKIMNALKESRNGLNLTALHKVFKNHLKKNTMQNVLNFLIQKNIIGSKNNKTKGRSSEIFFLKNDIPPM